MLPDILSLFFIQYLTDSINGKRTAEDFGGGARDNGSPYDAFAKRLKSEADIELVLSDDSDNDRELSSEFESNLQDLVKRVKSATHENSYVSFHHLNRVIKIKGLWLLFAKTGFGEMLTFRYVYVVNLSL